MSVLLLLLLFIILVWDEHSIVHLVNKDDTLGHAGLLDIEDYTVIN